MERREFLVRSALLAAGASALGTIPGCAPSAGGAAMDTGAGADLYSISLAQWSLNRAFFEGEIDPLDFPVHTREVYGLDAVEYVNQFFMDKARDQEWLAALKRRADDAGVRSLLIMCDSEGNLGDPDPQARAQAVDNHIKWLEAAAFLGCHSIRVNARSSGSREEQARLAADGLRGLCEEAEPMGLNVLVENHGGLSSDADWLVDVMERVDHPLVGTLPDFGNFRVSEDPEVWYDRYEGTEKMMPWAHAVSAKSYGFDDDGQETQIDYRRMMRIVLDAGYHGYVGIEYEGDQLAPHDGIIATRDLLRAVREELAAASA